MRCWLASNNFLSNSHVGLYLMLVCRTAGRLHRKVPKRPQTHGDAGLAPRAAHSQWDAHESTHMSEAVDWLINTCAPQVVQTSWKHIWQNMSAYTADSKHSSELSMQNRLNYIARRCLGIACWVLQVVEDCLWLHLHKTDVEFYWRRPGVNTTATLCLQSHVDDVAVCWTIWTEDHQRHLQQLCFDQVKGLCNDTSRKLDCTMLRIAIAHDSHSDRKCNSSNCYSQRMVASQFHCDVLVPAFGILRKRHHQWANSLCLFGCFASHVSECKSLVAPIMITLFSSKSVMMYVKGLSLARLLTSWLCF